MKFGPVPTRSAAGAVAAHAIRHGDVVLKKGARIEAVDVERLLAAGVEQVVVAALEPDDLPEDEAARRLAEAAAGGHVRLDRPFTGRTNLFATEAGVLLIDKAAIDRVNALDEAITVATLPAFKAVETGEMIGTVKIIPFAAPGALVEHAARALGQGAVRVAPFRPLSVGVISTLLPGLKPTVVEKTVQVLGDRLRPAGAALGEHRRIAHDQRALLAALRDLAGAGHDLIIVFGASAITDRRDVIPAALEQAGGVIEHFGMPVDPGNLLMLGSLGNTTVIGAPGCARSPKENGFDWVLHRVLAGVPVTRADIQGMGVGGLLMEIVSRGQPRAPDAPVKAAPVAAVVLAAGRSTRMGGVNKLLQPLAGKPLVRHAVEAALASAAAPVLVVTGHQAEAVRAVLHGLEVRFMHNPAYAEGLSTSLKAGLASVPLAAAGALVMLGDMPRVPPALLDRIVRAFGQEPDVLAVAPTVEGVRGNPVLIGRALFPALDGLSGDIGARKLLDAAGARLLEVPVDDAGVLLDVDTPETLRELQPADPV